MSDHMPSDLAAVDTPALVVDLDRLDDNPSRAA
jgi:D-serine deaminase-like pyridoxal phosphate-dependent protein